MHQRARRSAQPLGGRGSRERHELRNEYTNFRQCCELELKWYTHAKGERRVEWAPGSPVKTVNILVRGHFVLLFPDREIALAEEGDFVLFGPGVPHSFRSEQESLVLTVRWPSLPPNKSLERMREG